MQKSDCDTKKNMLKGIVLHHRKMVYWYLPKTACTTLKTYFARELGLHIPYRDGTEMDIHGQDIGFEFTEKVIPEYFNFAYVRNPFERFLSLYNQKIATKVDRKVFPDEKLFTQGMDFELFLDTCISIEHKERHYIPQSDLLPDCVHTYKMERDLFLKMLQPLNISSRIDRWTPETKKKAYRFYMKDFIRYGYHFNEYH